LVEDALSYKVTPGSKRSCDDVSGLADESFGRHMSWPLWIWVRPAGDAAVQILADVGFMVSEKRRPQPEERHFYCGGAPREKGGLQIWPKEQ
jgi:hypothetical protein